MALRSYGAGERTSSQAKVRLGYFEDMTTRLLVHKIESNVRLANLRKAGISDLRHSLNNGDLDVALLPVWDFLNSGRLDIIPAACLSWVIPPGLAMLCSKVLPTEIQHVLVDHECLGLRSLAHVVLPAQTGIRPEFSRSPVPLNPATFDFARDPHQAFLLAGENALQARRDQFTWMWDLAQGWLGNMNQPYVMHVWCCQKGILLRGVDDELAGLARANSAAPQEIIASESQRLGLARPRVEALYKMQTRTAFTPTEIAALRVYAQELAKGRILKASPHFAIYRGSDTRGTRPVMAR